MLPQEFQVFLDIIQEMALGTPSDHAHDPKDAIYAQSLLQ